MLSFEIVAKHTPGFIQTNCAHRDSVNIYGVGIEPWNQFILKINMYLYTVSSFFKGFIPCIPVIITVAVKLSSAALLLQYGNPNQVYDQ